MLAQVMLPGDANPQGDVHGGTIMKLVDTAGALAAVRHARSRVVTAVVDQMTFDAPVHVGDLVELAARLGCGRVTSTAARRSGQACEPSSTPAANTSSPPTTTWITERPIRLSKK